MRRQAVLIALLAAAFLFRFAAPASLSADNLTVGILSSNALTNFSNGNVNPEPLTLVDIDHPAPAAGNVTSATLYWSMNAPHCDASFKIKFLRPGTPGSFDFVDERGPFDSQGGLLTVALDPPVALQAGDVIAVVQLGKTTCGGVYLTGDAAGLHTLRLQGDDPGTVSACDPDSALDSMTVAAQATGPVRETLGAVVPGVGSVHGASGSNFKTALQLTNPAQADIQGHLVFHPMGQSASASDPSLAYSIPALGTVSFDDIVAALGATGLGSLDIMTAASYPPVASTRVFNDAGAAGTAGFTEPMVRPDDTAVLRHAFGYESTTLPGPSDPARFRFNIGVRSLASGASIVVVVYDAAGNQRKVLTRNYPPDEFIQLGAADFLNGYVLSANDSVLLAVQSGSAIVFAVSVDNVTNDTSFQLGDRRR
jgi:hypothetical protein